MQETYIRREWYEQYRKNTRQRNSNGSNLLENRWGIWQMDRVLQLSNMANSIESIVLVTRQRVKAHGKPRHSSRKPVARWLPFGETRFSGVFGMWQATSFRTPRETNKLPLAKGGLQSSSQMDARRMPKGRLFESLPPWLSVIEDQRSNYFSLWNFRHVKLYFF